MASPYNPTTGNRYRGVNILALMASAFTDPRWAGQSSVQVFFEKLRALIQYLTTPTDDPVPPFFRIIDADPHRRHYGVRVAIGRKTGVSRVAAVIFSYRTVSFLLQLPSAHPGAASHLARRAGRAFAG